MSADEWKRLSVEEQDLRLTAYDRARKITRDDIVLSSALLMSAEADRLAKEVRNFTNQSLQRHQVIEARTWEKAAQLCERYPALKAEGLARIFRARAAEVQR